MSTDAASASALRTLSEYQVSSGSTTKGSSSIGIDDFLKLFVAQLSSQDPLSSSSGSGSGMDYISQLAQLTMLEQMSALGNSFSANQAYSMIGKYVYLGKGSNSDLTFGKVDGVMREGGVNYLMVGGKAYDLSDVYAVVNDDAVSVATEDKVLQSANLIGKTVTASITETDDQGVETVSTVTGKVEKIMIEEGTIFLVIGDRKVALGNITEISQTAEAATA